MSSRSSVLFLTICSFGKVEGGAEPYDARYGIAGALPADLAASLLAARRQVFHLIKTPGAVIRDEKALDELRQNRRLVLGPDFDPDHPEPGGEYLPAARRYIGRFFSSLGGDPHATLVEAPHHVLLISGLYGLLRPTELIQCYSCHVPDHPDVPATWMDGGVLLNALAYFIDRHHITRVFELMGDDNYRQLIAWNQLQDRTGATVLHTEGEAYSGPNLLPSLGRLSTQLLSLTQGELLAIKPGDTRNVPGETITFRDHPPLAVRLKQASAYAELDDHKRALQVLADVTSESSDERMRLQERRIEVLLAAGRYADVIRETSSTSLSSYWTGLRGVALARRDNGSEADATLARAWTGGEPRWVVAREIARRAMERSDEGSAVEPYQVVLGDNQTVLDARDHHHIAALIDLGLLDGDRLAHADAFASGAGERELGALPFAPDLLRWRVERSRREGDNSRLARDYADLADCLCLRSDMAGLRELLRQLNHDRERRLLVRQQQFDLLEGLEPFRPDLPGLAGALTAEYLAIGFAEFDAALRANQPVPAFIDGLLRALLLLDANSHGDLQRYFQGERQKLCQAKQKVPSTEIAIEPAVALGGLRLALVGGHQQTRHWVLETLVKDHGLSHPVEVAPTSEGRLDLRSVADKIGNCDLVIVIKNYLGHDLSGMVADLERRGRLNGRAYWLDTRGLSGVVREVLRIVAAPSGR